jgi:hypothetical protein
MDALSFTEIGSGKKVTLDTMRGGKKLVVDFWHTKCTRCPAALEKVTSGPFLAPSSIYLPIITLPSPIRSFLVMYANTTALVAPMASWMLSPPLPPLPLVPMTSSLRPVDYPWQMVTRTS